MKKRTAILIACHKNSKQINMLLETLSHVDIDVYLHVDKKSNIYNEIAERKGLYVIRDEQRIDVKWGQISQVDATLLLLKEAYAKEQYGYYIYISGEDWPCKSIEKISDLCVQKKNRMYFWESLNHGGIFNNLDKRNTVYFPLKWIDRRFVYKVMRRIYVELTGGYSRTYKIFMRKNPLGCKFYFGSSWWGLNDETVGWMLDYLQKTPEYYKFFVNCANPDECFFQTLLMMSPFADINTDYLTYLNFLPGANSPEYITEEDLERAFASPYYFMRKVDLCKLDSNVFRDWEDKRDES